MKRRPLILGAIAMAAGLVLVAGSISGIRWRLGVVRLKLTGQMPDMQWGELLHMLQPGSGYYLAPLLSNHSPYATIENPLHDSAAVAAGADVYLARCAVCHRAGGVGGPAAPDLVRRPFQHGGSDWALYRAIRHGIPGTPMQPGHVSERETWQAVAYLRDRRAAMVDSARPAAAAITVPFAPVPFQRLLDAERDTSGWLTYSGSYTGQRYSPLREVNRQTVSRLRLSWMYQLPVTDGITEATPLVSGSYLYLSASPNDVYALDARSGDLIWHYHRTLPERLPLCCGRVNRGLAILDSTVFLGTLDAHLVALNARSGVVRWDIAVADPSKGYSITGAPLVVHDLVLSGVAGGEYGIRGFLAAYDVHTGKPVWRFTTIPGPGEPGHDSWPGETWQTGGGPTWVTGSYDPTLDLVYWGVGNPGPNYSGDARAGDNLFTNSVVALEARTGKLRWYFQFTPHDEHDWDANAVPLLIDGASGTRLLATANKNGFYYVLDRTTGRFIAAQPFEHQTWASGIDSAGRPLALAEARPSAHGTEVWPSAGGATNWWSPAFSPRTGLTYIPSLHKSSIYFQSALSYEAGEPYTGGASRPPDIPYWTSVRAVHAATGAPAWEYRLPTRTDWSIMGGLAATGGDLVFGSDRARFFALDATSGRRLWEFPAGAHITAAPIVYSSGGHEQITLVAGATVLTFSLPSGTAP